MKQLIIDESKWVNGSNKGPREGEAGPSALLNNKNNMCCLGFYALSCKYTDANIKNIYNLSDLKELHLNTKGKIPKKVFNKIKLWRDSWENIAIGINDECSLTSKSRKLRLINHFKKIGVKLSFIKSK